MRISVSAGVRIEVQSLEWLLPFLGVTDQVGHHRQEFGSAAPLGAASRLSHPHQLRERQGAWVDADNAGELPSESISLAAACAGSMLATVCRA